MHPRCLCRATAVSFDSIALRAYISPDTDMKRRHRRGDMGTSATPAAESPPRFRSPLRSAPITLDEMPLILTIDEVATFYRTSPSTIRSMIRNGGFEPPPFCVRPYRWKRADIEADLQRDGRALVKEHVKKTKRRKRS